MTKITFAIIEVDPAAMTATVEVLSSDELLSKTVVEVVDRVGSFLDEPIEDLIGRVGEAVLRNVWEWQIVSLACPTCPPGCTGWSPPRTCPDCSGSGRYVGLLSDSECQTCGGSGLVAG